jgi:hypothetical protein
MREQVMDADPGRQRGLAMPAAASAMGLGEDMKCAPFVGAEWSEDRQPRCGFRLRSLKASWEVAG